MTNPLGEIDYLHIHNLIVALIPILSLSYAMMCAYFWYRNIRPYLWAERPLIPNIFSSGPYRVVIPPSIQRLRRHFLWALIGTPVSLLLVMIYWGLLAELGVGVSAG